MTFARRFEGSPYAITKDTSATPKDCAVRIDSIVGASVLSGTTTRLFGPAGTYVDVTATAAEVLAVIDPIPTVTIPTAPTADVTGGKLRINPQGGAIAFQQNSSKGKWLIIYTNSSNEVNSLYTDDIKNPEIASWPYLTVKAN